MRRFQWGLAGVALSGLWASSVSAAVINLDYTHDSFFSSNPTAKAALEAAATDIGNVITTSLGATTDVSSGTYNSTTIDFDFGFSYTNPSTGATQTVSSAVLPANTTTIYVGWRNLSGSTLGQGGPGGYSVDGNADGFAAEVPNAVDIAEANANANMGRGGGPTIGTLGGDFGLANSDFSIGFGSTLGNLWFDMDTDNNGVTDDATTLASFWHFDHTTSVGTGKADLYSVAVHEILHALGIGTSDSWTSLVSGTDWLGQNVIDLLGSGEDVISATSGHIAEGIVSRRLSDLLAQEAVMDPTLTAGSRKYLTELDLAFLADIGWDVVAVPEPGAMTLLIAGAGLLALRRRRA